MTKNELALFIDKVCTDPSSGCWNWTAALRGAGKCPAFSIKRRQVAAHRVAYEHWVGKIPEGYQMHHKCENVRCVNPEHLQPLSPKEHKQLHKAKQTKCKQGHPFTEQNTYRNPRGQRECKECRRQATRRHRVQGVK